MRDHGDSAFAGRKDTGSELIQTAITGSAEQDTGSSKDTIL